jgi:hypothetical protein
MSLPGTEIRVEPDRQDVLARSSVGSRGNRQLLVTAALIASLAAVAGQALAADGWLSTISGTRLSALEFKNIEAHSIWGPAGRRFTCYNDSRLGRAKINGGMSCPGILGGLQFPSPELPVVDMSLTGADSAHPTMHTIRLTAVVANGIRWVGVLGSDGNVYGKTRVSGNFAVSGILPWHADGPTVAYGADGAVIWCSGNRGTAILYAAAGCPQPPAPSRPTP